MLCRRAIETGSLPARVSDHFNGRVSATLAEGPSDFNGRVSAALAEGLGDFNGRVSATLAEGPGSISSLGILAVYSLFSECSASFFFT